MKYWKQTSDLWFCNVTVSCVNFLILKKEFKETLQIMVQNVFRVVYLEYIMAIYCSVLCNEISNIPIFSATVGLIYLKSISILTLNPLTWKIW